MTLTSYKFTGVNVPGLSGTIEYFEYCVFLIVPQDPEHAMLISQILDLSLHKHLMY